MVGSCASNTGPAPADCLPNFRERIHSLTALLLGETNKDAAEQRADRYVPQSPFTLPAFGNVILAPYRPAHVDYAVHCVHIFPFDAADLSPVQSDECQRHGDQGLRFTSKPGQNRFHFLNCVMLSLARFTRFDKQLAIVNRIHPEMAQGQRVRENSRHQSPNVTDGISAHARTGKPRQKFRSVIGLVIEKPLFPEVRLEFARPQFQIAVIRRGSAFLFRPR